MGTPLQPGHKDSLEMSWTWAGFWQDDPVFRFNGSDFFQSGRHKAEERFWKNYIHDDGSYRAPLRSRMSSGVSFTSNTSTPSLKSCDQVQENYDDILNLTNLTRDTKVDEDEKKEEGKDKKRRGERGRANVNVHLSQLWTLRPGS